MPNRQLIPFGFKDQLFVDILSKKLRSSFSILNNFPNSSLFLCVGSGTILEALFHAFPTLHFKMVRIGEYYKLSDILKGNMSSINAFTYLFLMMPFDLS
jgi:hypothetical protein